MPRVRNVNTTDLKAALELGARCMSGLFNADDPEGVPFFSSSLRPEARLSFSGAHSESHVPGRHLNALLEAEDAAGIEVDEEVVRRHRHAALLSYSGAAPLALNRKEIGGPLVSFCPHNLREGFHALYALAAFRGDGEAAEIAERSVRCIFDLWSPDEGWDRARLESLGLEYMACQGFVHGEARMLGPLVKIHRAIGSAAALELALVLRDKLLAETFPEDGSWDPERVGTSHVHSITCCLSSLAQLAAHLGDAVLMQRVRAFYDGGLWQLRDEIGWTPESTTQTDSDHGEANNTGDILETALILGRHGCAAAYADAERILRCHLLPSQLRDASFIEEPPNPEGLDGLRDPAGRHLGAFGFPAPYGHESAGQGRAILSFNMDIVGGACASIAAACREVVRADGTGVHVDLWFDWESEAASVASPYTQDGRLTVRVRQPGPLWLRLPPWLEGGLVVAGDAPEPRRAADHLFWRDLPAGTAVEARVEYPEREIVLSPRLHRRPIRARLRGDAVAAMEDFGADLAWFDPLGRG